MKFWSKLRALFRKEKLDAEMVEEMRLHLEMQTERNIAAGMDPDEARYAARRQFGGVEQIKEAARDQRGWIWLENRWRDFRYAGRQLRRSPGFTTVAALTLALAIGACGAIFTVVNSVLLQPIALPDSERLMVLQETNPRVALVSVSPASFRAWAEEADLFESMAIRTGYNYNLIGQGDPVQVAVAGVTGRYFEVLRVQPMLGQLIGPREDAPGKNNVLVLTHAFWQRQLGGRTDVLGSALKLNGQLFSVLGVLPPGFQSGDAEVFTPLGLPDAWWQSHARMFSAAIGRLKPGVAIEQAREQMNTIAARLAEERPEWNKDWAVRVVSLLEFETHAVRPTFYALLAAVAVLLVIACATIANLVLVRATVRRREISVRAALGASRSRIVEQLFSESLLVALLGGTLGLWIAKVGVGALLALAPFAVPRVSEIALDVRMVAFVFGLTLLTGVGVGLVPAWSSTRLNLVDALKGSDRGASDGRILRLMREVLVVAQIALALVLLTGAGLLMRSFVRLSQANPGFQPDGALMLKVETQHRTAEKQLAFVETMIERFRMLPGVNAVGATYALPFSGDSSPSALEIEGRDVPANARPGMIGYRITPDYFRAMGIPLVGGRAFNEHDSAGGAPVAIVSQSLADRFFTGMEPIGRRIKWEGRNRDQWREIVGVVADVRTESFDQDIVPQVYEPFAQSTSHIVSFVVRADAASAGLAPLLRRELHAVEPELPVCRLDLLKRLVTNSIAKQRFSTALFGVFSAVALLLASAGIYGVMAYTVAQRSREFGIRLALGARPADLRALVLGRAGRLVTIGVVIGGAGSYAATRLIETLLYQTPARDPVVIAVDSALLAGVAFVACWLPARRAAKVDPMVALRAE